MLVQSSVRSWIAASAFYYRALWHILVSKCSYDDLRKLCNAPRIDYWSKIDQKDGLSMSAEEEHSLFVAVWLHTISLNLELWSKPHYRANSLRDDLIANFSNIAFPGTGIPLSWVCYSKVVAIMYFILLHPFVVLASSIGIFSSAVHRKERAFGNIFAEELLAP